MADTAKRLLGPSLLTGSEQTFYTVPGVTTAILRHLHFANTGVLPVTVKFSVGADAAGTRFIPDLSIPGNGTYDWSGFFVLNAAETLRGQAATTNVINVTASGVEVT